MTLPPYLAEYLSREGIPLPSSPAILLDDMGMDGLDRSTMRNLIEENSPRDLSDIDEEGWLTLADVAAAARESNEPLQFNSGVKA